MVTKKTLTKRGSCLDTARTLPRHVLDSCCGIDSMDSSFFALNPRRLSGFYLRSGHSLSSWDGSEPGLEIHATPQLPQWAQPSGVLFPQTLSIIKPCPDVDGYYPMVRLVTSVPAPLLLHLSSILFLSCYIPNYLPVFSSIRTELVWIFLQPVGPICFFLRSLHTQLPFSASRHSIPLLLCFPEPLQDRAFVSLLLLLLLLLFPAPRPLLGIRPGPLGHEQVRLLSSIHTVADKLAAAARLHVLAFHIFCIKSHC